MKGRRKKLNNDKKYIQKRTKHSIFRDIRLKQKISSIKILWDYFSIFALSLRLKLFFVPKPGILKTVLFVFILSALTTTVAAHIILTNLPSPNDLLTRQVPATTKIYDRNAVLLYKIYKEQNRTPIKIEEIPLHVRLATLAAEDAEFYTHPGFSLKGISRSLLKLIREGRLTGGSTITQQLVKNTLLSPERTLKRKLREIVLSIQVEALFSKDQILEMYINEVSYGNSAYGIQEASKVYFGKDAKDLTLAEAALLAGLPKGPTKFSPFGPNPELSKTRQLEILSLMEEKQFISSDLAEAAENEELNFATLGVEIKAPHFVMYVRDKLVELYGEEMVEKGGLEVTTTLDYEIQIKAEGIVTNEVEKLANVHVTNGAAVVVEPRTGEILAMVGSKDYFDEKIDGNVNVVLRPRSPGSSIKPVTYSYALEHGMTPATIIPDTPTVFPLPNQPDYIPRNYDSNFRGNISLRSALAESRNIPAVKVVMEYGVEKIMEWGHKMGIESWQDPDRYGPSITLGGGELKLIELAQVYSAIANMGEKAPLQVIRSIKNQNSAQLFQFNCCQREKILDPRVAFIIIDILRDNIARSPSFGSGSSLVITNHPEVAVKTGTSNDLRDNLTVGFNQDYLTAVWVGNNDNSPMSRIASGVTGAAPIWNKIMQSLLSNTESKSWEIPKDLVQAKDCFNRIEWFLKENQNHGKCPNPSPGPSPTPKGSLRPSFWQRLRNIQ